MKNKNELFECILCQNKNVVNIISFPKTPLANKFVPVIESNLQIFFPLDLGLCDFCGHLQLTHIIPPHVLFEDYPYVSNSNTETEVRFKLLADEYDSLFKSSEEKFAIEIGSNDGFLIGLLQDKGWRVLGIDPAIPAAEIATIKKIPNICDFFSESVADQVLFDHGIPQLIIANNVLAHTDQMNDIFLGISSLMSKETILVMEFSYALDIYEKLLVDTIYHEHMSYHQITSLSKFLLRFGLSVEKAVRFHAHGGSARLYIRKFASTEQDPSVKLLLDLEEQIGLSTVESWEAFAFRIEELKTSIHRLLAALKKENKTIAGYGIPAKFSTLFHVLELNENDFAYFVDDNPMKVGMYAPGTSKPIFPVDRLEKDRVDYIFLFSWNYKSEISSKIWKRNLCESGIIVPLPELKTLKN
jgi:hypothetical protein